MTIRWPAVWPGRRTAPRSGPAREFVEPAADRWPGVEWRPPQLGSAPHRALRDAGRRQRAGAGLAGRAQQATGGMLAEVAGGSALNLAGAGVATISTLGVTVLVTRLFSRPVAGAFFSATSLFLVAEAVAGLGAFTGLVYFITRLRLLREDGRIDTIIRAAIIPVVAVAVTFAVALVVFASPLARLLLGGHFGTSEASPPAMATALRALAAALPFAAVLDTLLGATRGYRDMRPTVAVSQIARSAGQLAGVAIAAVAGSAALLAPLWAIPYVPAMAAGWIWLRRIRRKHSRPRPRQPVSADLTALMSLGTQVLPDGRRVQRTESTDQRLSNATPRGFWRFTSPRSVAVLAQIIVQRIDIVLVAIIRGPSEAAIYTVATRFLVVGQLGNQAISMAAQPRFTELFTVGANRRANVVYQVTTAWLIVLTWPLYLLAVAYGPQFLAIFGHSYRAGYTVLIILAVASLVSAACGQVDMVLITTGRTSWSLVNGLLAMTTNVGLDLLLIPRYGITGAAIGWAAAIGVANIMPLMQIALTKRLNPFGRVSILAAALCGISFYLIPQALRYTLGTGLRGIGVAIVAGCVVLGGGLWYFRDTLRLSVMPGLSFFMRRFSNEGWW